MERLVYSPKAFVYIYNETGLHNLSEYVVSGNVNRKINAPSTAEVTFRNPHRKFTQPGNPTFRPMDRITIFLQRLPGIPVQSFTGYLDSAPYYQMYPGTCTISATCTLKRLQYTYFDPGLPFMMKFMAKYGWIPNGSGGILNASGPSNSNKTPDEYKDASIAELILATMHYVGGWDTDPKTGNVVIEKLPGKLVDRLHDIYSVVTENREEQLEEFEAFLKTFVGSNGNVSDGGSGDPESSYSGPLDKDFGANSKVQLSERQVAMIAESVGLPGVTFAQIARGESSYMPGAVSNDGGHGLWQITPRVHSPELQKRWKRMGSFYNPVTNAKMAKVLFDAAGGKISPWFGTDYVTDFNPPYEHYTGKISSVDDTENEDDSRQPADEEKTGGKKKDSSTEVKIYKPINGPVTYGRGWHESTKGVTAMTTTSGSLHWHSGIDVACSTGTPCVAPCDGVISFATSNWSDGGMVHFKFTKDVGEIKAGTIIGWGHCTNIKVRQGERVKGGKTLALSGNPGGGPHVHFIQRDDGQPGGGDGNTDPKPLLLALQRGETAPTTGGDDNVDNMDGGGTGADALVAAKASTLLTQFQFPAAFDQAESLLLRGDRSLMNDQPLLPFIEELCKGSMRHFMSLPNGDFYAFHPDYFGSFDTKPYWSIDDVEILEGNIQLSDEALATHVFVNGATLPEQMITLPQKLNSAGVINILNAGTADFLNIPPPDQDKVEDSNKEEKKRREKNDAAFLGDYGGALRFLARYGARPVVEDATFIRSHIFETFYAFQTFMLLWSRQFLTPFTFTFMPELYPGGLVQFPHHGIRCYIDEVHHSFDYSNGFVTQANLSAPSSLDPQNKITQGMVQAGILGEQPKGD